MKHGTVYKRARGLYFHSDSETTAGVWIATAPYLQVSLDSGHAAIGDAVMRVLEASQQGIEHPTEWRGLFDPLLDLAKVNSWSVFMRNARLVSLELEHGALKVVPHRNLNAKEGFESIDEQAVEVSLEDGEEELGMALEEAFGRCR